MTRSGRAAFVLLLGTATGTAGERPFGDREGKMSLQLEVGGIPYEQRDFRIEVARCAVVARLLEQGGGRTWSRTAEFMLADVSAVGVRSAGYETNSSVAVLSASGRTRFTVPSVAVTGVVKYACITREAEACDTVSTGEFVHGAETSADAEHLKAVWQALAKRCRPSR